MIISVLVNKGVHQDKQRISKFFYTPFSAISSVSLLAWLFDLLIKWSLVSWLFDLLIKWSLVSWLFAHCDVAVHHSQGQDPVHEHQELRVLKPTVVAITRVQNVAVCTQQHYKSVQL